MWSPLSIVLSGGWKVKTSHSRHKCPGLAWQTSVIFLGCWWRQRVWGGHSHPWFAIYGHVGVAGMTPFEDPGARSWAKKRDQSLTGFYFCCECGEAACIFPFLFHFKVKTLLGKRHKTRCPAQLIVTWAPGWLSSAKGLNCVLSKFTCWSLDPRQAEYDCICRQGLWRGDWVKRRPLGWVLINLTGVLVRRGDEDTEEGEQVLRGTATWRQQARPWPAQERGLRRKQSAYTLVSDFRPPALWENTFLCWCHRVWHFVWQPSQTKTPPKL